MTQQQMVAAGGTSPAAPSPVLPRGWHECIVAASGPSLTPEVAARCRGRRVIAVNDAYRLLPFADVLYAGDGEWWDVHQGCPDFAGEKWVVHQPRLPGADNASCAARYGLRMVAGASVIDAGGFSQSPARIHYGNCSGFQAINLAILFGATRIVLVGFDMRVVDGRRHFFGDHQAPLGNNAKYEHFLPAFDHAARSLPAHIQIVNCTPGSALRSFPRAELEAELAVPLASRRAIEHQKYVRAYTVSEYRMGDRRMRDTLRDLSAIPRGSLLDVGCGRGEMLDIATRVGFAPVRGVDVVPAVIDGERVVRGEVHALPFPDKAFDVVTMFDVIEHLIPGDDELACRELARVARRHILITANNETSQRAIGEELHINRRPYKEWDALFRSWFPGAVTWIKGHAREHVSEAWRVDL